MKLTIGLCSDTHGKPLPQFDSADMVLHAGDLYEFDQIPNDEHAVRIVEYLRSNRVVFVKGNHDLNDPLKLMKADLSGQVVPLCPGLWLVGIGFNGSTESGSVGLPNEGHLRPICRKVCEQAVANFKDGDRCILMTHYPAKVPEFMARNRGRSTEGFFFDCVRVVCEALQPLLVVQGHTHSFNGQVIPAGGLQYAWPGPKGMVLTVDTEGWQVSLAGVPKKQGPTLFDA